MANDVSVRNRALCAAWLDWASKRLAPITCHHYALRCEHLCVWANEVRLADLSLADMEGWLNRPRRGGQPASASTLNGEIFVLTGLYGWALSHGHITTNPTSDLRALANKNHNPRAIPVELWRTVWCDDSLSDAERVMLGLGFFCGLRRAEMCQLRGKHFVDDQILHFPRKGDRSKKESGVIPFVSCARLFAERKPELLSSADDFLTPLARLAVIAQANDEWLIPWGSAAKSVRLASTRPGPPEGMTSPDQINHRLTRLLTRLKVSNTAFTPHALRHSFVTYLLQAGIPLVAVSKLANHNSVSTTMRYVRVADDPLAEFIGRPLTGTSRWASS